MGATTALDQLVVLASTFRQQPAEGRGALAEALAQIGDRCAEHLLLHTCHRVELIAVVDRELPAPPDGVHRFEGADAVERVLLVTAGFDSAVTAEEQLLGQVRDAYESALARGTTGAILNELLRRAIRLGRRVRSQATPTADRSLADRGASWALARLDGRPADARAGAALVLGSGEMGRILATRLAAAGLSVTLASRRLERAERAAETIPGEVRAAVLDGVVRDVAGYDIVAVALRGGDHVLHPPAFTGAPHPIVVDLSAPSAVSDAVRTLVGDDLLDLDGLGRASAPSPLTPRAERRLREELAAERLRYLAWLEARERGAAIGALRRHAAELQERHLDRLRRQADLAPEQLAAVEAAVSALLAELLHAPTDELRHGGDDADALLTGLGVER